MSTYRLLRSAYRYCFAFLVLSFSDALLAQSPANDHFAHAGEIHGASGEAYGSNVGASDEYGEPTHAGVGRNSVWWRWTAVGSGPATFDTFGSDFDTVLAVYVGDSVSSLRPIAWNDDSGFTLQSSVRFPVEAGSLYHAAVSGYGGGTGAIRLSWAESELLSPVDCALAPDSSTEPPSDTARASAIRERILYGEDDRRDIYQEPDPRIVEAWEATGALVHESAITANGDGTWSLRQSTFQQLVGVCPDEPYANQPLVAVCSGFLVAPGVVATAGHCVMGGFWRELYFVRGFRMLDANTAVCTLPDSMVHRFRDLIDWDLGSPSRSDWALLQLDGEAPSVQPLAVRRSGRITEGEGLIVIGHPMGLPAKIADGATVTDSRYGAYIVSDLDTYAGNSGSAVLNSETLEVEGVLVRGEYPEFVQDHGCLRSRVCRPGECGGEEVTRSTEFAALIPSEDFLRADSDSDGLVAVNDGIYTLDHLFLGGPDPDCFDAADANDDGVVNMTDAIVTLRYVILGDLQFSTGLPVCGPDLTDDDLTCEGVPDGCRDGS